MPIYDNLPRETYANYEDYLFDFLRKLEILRNQSFKQQYKHHRQLEKKLNDNRRDFPFKLGQWVSKRTFKVGNQAKLAFRYEGPYEIVRIYPNGVTFQIQDIQSNEISKIHGKHLANYQKTHDKPIPLDKPKEQPSSEEDAENGKGITNVDEEKVVAVLDRFICTRKSRKQINQLIHILEEATQVKPVSTK